MEYEVKEFVEPIKKVFFPKVVEIKSYKANKLDNTGELEFKDIIFNSKPNFQDYDLTFPEGIRVYNYIKKQRYIVDKSGKAIFGTIDPFNPPARKQDPQPPIPSWYMNQTVWTDICTYLILLFIFRIRYRSR